jgi:hypothetical protein
VALPLLLLVLSLPAKQGWFLPLVAFLVIGPNLVVTVATVRAHSHRIEDRLAADKNIYDPGIVATTEYERLAALAQRHQVYFFIPDESEGLTARIFRAQFLRYSPKETRLPSELSAEDVLVMPGNSYAPPAGYRCPEFLLGLKVCFRLDVDTVRNVVGR